MKKARVLLALLVVGTLLVLGGCVDVLQYISGTSYSVSVFTRFTLQKSIFEAAAAFGGDSSQTMPDLSEEIPLDQATITDEMPPWLDASFEPIDTEMEYGFEMRYTAPREELARLPDDEAGLVPRVLIDRITIPLSAGSETPNDPFSTALLGSAKYRLMISKLFLSRVSAAYLVDGDEMNELAVTDLPDVWLIEFPMSLWFGATGTPRIEVWF